MALVSLLLALQGADVASLVRDLDHDGYEVRRKAFGELVKVGTAALPALHETARSGPSLEVRDASTRIIDAILAKVREDFIVEHAAKPKNFACGGLGFASPSESALRTKDLSVWFPSCTFLVGGYTCMHRAPICRGEWLLGLSEETGEVFTIRKERNLRVEFGEPEALSKHLKPARTAGEATELSRLLGGVAEFDAEGRLVRISKGE